MDYEVRYGINCGSTCLGGRLSDYVEVMVRMDAESVQAAFDNALKLAACYSIDYLSDPITGLTKVKILSIKNSIGDVLPQQELNTRQSTRFEQGQAVVVSDSLDKIFLVDRVDSTKSNLGLISTMEVETTR